MKPLRNIVDICEYLRSQEYPSYQLLAFRLEQGDIKITFGNDTWNPNWYSETAWEKRSFPLVFSLMDQLGTSNNFHLYYDSNKDFHHIEFDFDGDRYDVRWYKVYGITRLSDKKDTTLNNEYGVVDFFRRGHHRDFKFGWAA